MPQQGQRIGEYLLDEKVGQGAFGEVWRAHHHVWTDQQAAVKIPTHPEYVKNLRREGIALARVDHPNIVRPLGFDPYAEVPYLISEFVPGTSLRPIITGKTVGFDDAVAIISQVLRGLAEAHAAGVVHGDIKPENVLVHQNFRTKGLNEPGIVKVTDFGVGLAATTTATEALSSGGFQHSSSMNLAATLAYVSPEQRDGSRPADARSDLFAVGVVLFELLTGERPVGNDLPTELNFKVPVYLDDVFRKAYSRREKRFASAQDFLAAIEAGRNQKPPAPLPKRVQEFEPDSVSLNEPSRAPTKAVVPAPADDDDGPIGFKDDDAPQRDVRPKRDESDDFGVLPVAEPPAGASRGGTRAAVVASTETAAGLSGSAAGLSGSRPGTSGTVSGMSDTAAGLNETAVGLSGTSAGTRGPGETRAGPGETRAGPGETRGGTRGPGETRAGSGETHAGPGETRAGRSETGSESFTSSRAPATKKPVAKKPSAAARVDGPPVRTDAPGTIGFDELRQKTVITPNELILRFREFENARTLDAGEKANLILRLNPWASEISKGHATDFGRQIEIVKAFEVPTYRVTARDRLPTTAKQRQQVARHPAVPEGVAKSIEESDFSTKFHVSASVVQAEWFNSVPPPHLRDAVRKVVATDGAGLVRQDLRIDSAMTFLLRYKYEGKEYDVAFVGPQLRVVAVALPFDAGTFDLTKRAAAMLDAGQVQAGLKEIHKCIETGYREQQAVGMLRALRRKLSAAYMGVAADQLGGIEWLESLRSSENALVLEPDSPAPREHAHQVDIRATLIHTGPGSLIALTFCLFAAITSSPAGAYGYLAAAGASLVTGVIIWRVLKARMARTDISFYHSAVLPTLISGAVAIGFANKDNPTAIIICTAIGVITILADVLAFKKLRPLLFRGRRPEEIPADAMESCVRVESMVATDWDRLKPHFDELLPLAEYVKVKR